MRLPASNVGSSIARCARIPATASRSRPATPACRRQRSQKQASARRYRRPARGTASSSKRRREGASPHEFAKSPARSSPRRGVVGDASGRSPELLRPSRSTLPSRDCARPSSSRRDRIPPSLRCRRGRCTRGRPRRLRPRRTAEEAKNFRQIAESDDQKVEIDRLAHPADGFQHPGRVEGGGRAWEVDSCAPIFQFPIMCGRRVFLTVSANAGCPHGDAEATTEHAPGGVVVPR